MSLKDVQQRVNASVAGEVAMGKAREFTERHGFRSYRLNRPDGGRYEPREVHVSVNAWVYRGASVAYDEQAGTVTITPKAEENRPAFTYLGRKSK